MSHSSDDVIILGGGIAGLSVGYFLQKQNSEFSIYEASDEVGGNCRTLKIGDFKVDTGAHRFHDKDEQMTSEIKTLMGDKISEISVPSFIFFNNQLVHFPLTPVSVFTSLPPKILLKALWHFLKDKFLTGNINDFESLAYKKYGRPIADLFLTNYSEKLWGEKCSTLSVDVSGTRLKNLTRKTLSQNSYSGKKNRSILKVHFFTRMKGLEPSPTNWPRPVAPKTFTCQTV